MVSHEQIEALIPHKGSMCLWQEVSEWDAQRHRQRATGHVDTAQPLRAKCRLHAQHQCENCAQANAVHGGLRGSVSGQPVRPGMLVALRGVQLHCVRIDDLPGALECEAELLAESPATQQYLFRIVHDGALLAEGRAAVMLQG